MAAEAEQPLRPEGSLEAVQSWFRSLGGCSTMLCGGAGACRGERIDSPTSAQTMLALFVSAIAFVIASYAIRRYLDDIGVPRTMVRSLVIMVLALAISYGVAFIVDNALGLLG